MTKTVTFTVESPTSSSLAQSYPYGSGNPYPVGGSSTSAATSGSRSTLPATSAAMPTSGSVSTTLALLIGGFFFLVAGGWSYWLAGQINETT